MVALAGIATLAFIVAGTVVGIRLFQISRQTHGVAERNIGLGLILICGITYPAGLLLPVDALPEIVRRVASIVSITALAAGSIFISIFVQGVFRSGSSWALWLTRAFGLAWAALAISSYWGAATGQIEALTATESVRFLGRQLLMLGLFLWSSIESVSYWLKMRRRRAFGLAEPEVVNRFALWGISGVASVMSILATTSVGLRGTNPLEDPAALLVTGISGVIASTSMVLAFMPPKAYLAWLRREGA